MAQLTSSAASRSLPATLLLLLLVAAASSASAAAAPAVRAPTVDAACHNDIVALRGTCYEFIQVGGPAVAPSPGCCAALIGVANVPCVCLYLGSEMDVDPDKVSFVARQCGVTVPINCGAFKQV